MATRSLSDARLTLDPALIRFKISPHNDLSGTQGGDWDIERRISLEGATKHRAIRQRYVEGLGWAETDLFRDLYARRIEREPIRGETTMRGLLRQYETRVDAMFADMKANGFRDDKPLPVLLIGRDQVFIGNQGNHRLAMAQILGLKEFAGKVICRHPLA